MAISKDTIVLKGKLVSPPGVKRAEIRKSPVKLAAEAAARALTAPAKPAPVNKPKTTAPVSLMGAATSPGTGLGSGPDNKAAPKAAPAEKPQTDISYAEKNQIAMSYLEKMLGRKLPTTAREALGKDYVARVKPEALAYRAKNPQIPFMQELTDNALDRQIQPKFDLANPIGAAAAYTAPLNLEGRGPVLKESDIETPLRTYKDKPGPLTLYSELVDSVRTPLGRQKVRSSLGHEFRHTMQHNNMQYPAPMVPGIRPGHSILGTGNYYVLRAEVEAYLGELRKHNDILTQAKDPRALPAPTSVEAAKRLIEAGTYQQFWDLPGANYKTTRGEVPKLTSQPPMFSHLNNLAPSDARFYQNAPGDTENYRTELEEGTEEWEPVLKALSEIMPGIAQNTPQQSATKVAKPTAVFKENVMNKKATELRNKFASFGSTQLDQPLGSSILQSPAAGAATQPAPAAPAVAQPVPVTSSAGAGATALPPQPGMPGSDVTPAPGMPLGGGSVPTNGGVLAPLPAQAMAPTLEDRQAAVDAQTAEYKIQSAESKVKVDELKNKTTQVKSQKDMLVGEQNYQKEVAELAKVKAEMANPQQAQQLQQGLGAPASVDVAQAGPSPAQKMASKIKRMKVGHVRSIPEIRVKIALNNAKIRKYASVRKSMGQASAMTEVLMRGITADMIKQGSELDDLTDTDPRLIAYGLHAGGSGRMIDMINQRQHNRSREEKVAAGDQDAYRDVLKRGVALHEAIVKMGNAVFTIVNEKAAEADLDAADFVVKLASDRVPARSLKFRQAAALITERDNRKAAGVRDLPRLTIPEAAAAIKAANKLSNIQLGAHIIQGILVDQPELRKAANIAVFNKAGAAALVNNDTTTLAKCVLGLALENQLGPGAYSVATS